MTAANTPKRSSKAIYTRLTCKPSGWTTEVRPRSLFTLCAMAGPMPGSVPFLGKGRRRPRHAGQFLQSEPSVPKTAAPREETLQQRGHLVGLDGRRLHVRSEHGALNLLIQSAAALIAKKWLELVDDEIRAQGVPARSWPVVHDELQIQVKSETKRCRTCRSRYRLRMAQEAGRFFKNQMPNRSRIQRRDNLARYPLRKSSAFVGQLVRRDGERPGSSRSRPSRTLRVIAPPKSRCLQARACFQQRCRKAHTATSGWLPKTGLGWMEDVEDALSVRH